MSELRLNLVTREWVVIATDRAKRPVDFIDRREKRNSVPHATACPFCPGNEHKTPMEHFRLSENGSWRIRVVANRYPALAGEGDRRRTSEGFKRAVTGVGRHEIIIESPSHNKNIPSFDQKHVEDLIHIYKGRFIEAHTDPRVEHVIIFKNHGEGAGTSLEHPHTQLVAVPVVPIQFRDRVQSMMHFFDDTGECLLCSMIKKETEEKARVIIDTEHFFTFIPYAALSPFHTWIFPKRHSASFADIREEEAADLAKHLRTLLGKFQSGLEDPDYNYVIRSSRPQDAANEYCHWYMSLVPRITKVAGFELGSGMYINTALPEESAGFLRSIPVTL